MKKLNVTVNLIVKMMNDAIKADEARWHYKYERTNMQNFLDEIYSGMTSEEFKKEVLWLLNNHDNENYANGIDYQINVMDDGSIEDETGTIYSYRQIIANVRKKLFHNVEEELI